MSPLSQLAASFMPLLLDVSIKSTAILALAWAGTSLMRGKSAAARHLVWLTAVLATLCLPVLALLLPSWRALPASMDVPSRLAVFPALTALPTSSGANSVPQEAIQAHQSVRTLDRAALLAAVWGCGMAIALLPALIGRWRLARFAGSCSNASDDELLRQTQAIQAELRVRRRVAVLLTDEAAMPMTWGAFRPKLLLPTDAHNWSITRRQAALAHEMAHIKRLDCLTHLVAQIARAVYWFNPLSWIALRQMETERERACDDLVIRAGIRQADYAREIVEICATCFNESSGAVAMPFAGASVIERRLRNILDDTQTRGALTMRHLSIAIFALTLIVVPMSMLHAADAPIATKPATQPVRAIGLLDFKGRDQMTQVAQSMKLLMLYTYMYANDHSGALPADQGEMVSTLNVNVDADHRATIFVDPRNPVDVPRQLTADWVNKNSAWTYIGGGVSQGALAEPATTVLIYSDLDKPFGNQIIAGYADGHVEYVRIDDAKKIVEQSKQRIEDAKPAGKGKI